LITLGVFNYFTMVVVYEYIYMLDPFYVFSLMTSLSFYRHCSKRLFFYSSIYLNGEKEKEKTEFNFILSIQYKSSSFSSTAH
jgi:hypothetical protein